METLQGVGYSLGFLVTLWLAIRLLVGSGLQDEHDWLGLVLLGFTAVSAAALWPLMLPVGLLGFWVRAEVRRQTARAREAQALREADEQIRRRFPS